MANKTIRCSRCRKRKVVPESWHFKECQTCRERTIKRFRRVSITTIEKKQIEKLLDFEQVWKNYKQFCRQWKRNPKPKEDFRTEWLKTQEHRIEGIKKTIEKYDDKRCPILSYKCLEFRRLFSVRLNYINTEDFKDSLTQQETDLFYNHLSCSNCNQYAIIHKYDAPIESKFNEDGVSQKEFDTLLDGFFEATKPHRDQIEEMEQLQGLKEIPIELLKHPSSEYAKQEKE